MVGNMALDNVESILSLRSPLSSFKLLCVAANFSRPQLRSVWKMLLKPFVREGEISLRYWCLHRYLTVFLRLNELESDFQCALELAASDIYRLDPTFVPDLIIDGGGNIGFFSLRAAAISSGSSQPPKIVIYEPMKRNSDQCRRHLTVNRIEANIVNACVGGTPRAIPFYCRDAINSSFDPGKPYDRIEEIPVHLLNDAIGDYPAERILVKLDIEGMEVEALEAFVPRESRAVYIVGELHDVTNDGPRLMELFHGHDWSFEMDAPADDQAIFRACSPAARPLLPSIQQASAMSR
jgi:FkbM family methyltransferase